MNLSQLTNLCVLLAVKKTGKSVNLSYNLHKVISFLSPLQAAGQIKTHFNYAFAVYNLMPYFCTHICN